MVESGWGCSRRYASNYEVFEPRKVSPSSHEENKLTTINLNRLIQLRTASITSRCSSYSRDTLRELSVCSYMRPPLDYGN